MRERERMGVCVCVRERERVPDWIVFPHGGNQILNITIERDLQK